MAATVVKLPKLGETVELNVVCQWLVEPGQQVAEGEDLLEVETDKAISTVPSPLAGTVVQLLVEPDDEIEVGTPICEIEVA